MGGKKEDMLVTKILMPKTFETILERVPTNEQKTFLAFLYLTGSRVSEALAMRYRDFRQEEILGNLVTFVTIPVLKHKTPDFRNIPLWVHKDEYKLGALVTNYVALIPPEKNEYSRIWERSRNWAWLLVKKYIGKSPHWLRHNRAAYLATVLGWNEYKLVSYFNWSDPSISYRYTKGKRPMDFVDDLLKSFGREAQSSKD